MVKAQGQHIEKHGSLGSELGTYALAFAVLSGRDVRSSVEAVSKYAHRPNEGEVYRMPKLGGTR